MKGRVTSGRVKVRIDATSTVSTNYKSAQKQCTLGESQHRVTNNVHSVISRVHGIYRMLWSALLNMSIDTELSVNLK